MRDIKSKIICLSIVVIVFYFIYNQPKTNKKMEMKKRLRSAAELNANAIRKQNVYVNADQDTNTNVQRSQHEQLDIDRLPLVEENTHIIPANEIVQINYKGCHSTVEKEVYTEDAPLFDKAPSPLVPLDVNDTSHKRVNFY